jgi:Protein required for attachment to host cells
MAKTETWVLVADAAGARVLRADAETRRLELLRTYPHEEGRAKPSDLVADRPGRSFESTGPAEASIRAEPVAGMPWSRIRM